MFIWPELACQQCNLSFIIIILMLHKFSCIIGVFLSFVSFELNVVLPSNKVMDKRKSSIYSSYVFKILLYYTVYM